MTQEFSASKIRAISAVYFAAACSMLILAYVFSTVFGVLPPLMVTLGLISLAVSLFVFLTGRVLHGYIIAAGSCIVCLSLGWSNFSSANSFGSLGFFLSFLVLFSIPLVILRLRTTEDSSRETLKKSLFTLPRFKAKAETKPKKVANR